MDNEQNIIHVPRIRTDLNAKELDRPEWNNARPAKINRYWSGETAPPGRHAEARILWSDKALHLRFVCNQSDPLVVSQGPQFTTKTMNLWDRDVCEIFIAPDPTVIERYLEFEVAPTGEWLDVAIDLTSGKRQSDWKFHSAMTTGAKIEQGRVSMGIRIPWDHWIHEPQKGERWRANLLRCVGSGETRGYLAWQPTRTLQPNFHVPQVFGWLVFD